MSSAVSSLAAPDRPQHNRSKSAAVLKSIMTPNRRKVSPTEASPLKPRPNVQQLGRPESYHAANNKILLLPWDHPHGQPIRGERHQTDIFSPHSPQKSSFEDDAAKEERRLCLKQKKSYTNISGLLFKQRSPKKPERELAQPKGKENTAPPSSAGSQAYAPIWVQFASQPITDDTAGNGNAEGYGQRSGNAEFAPYALRENSLAKRRNAHEYDVPSLCAWENLISRPSPSKQASGLGPTSNEGVLSSSSSPQKRSSRVLAAVAIFDGKGKGSEHESKLLGKGLEAAFEAVLVSRNIPENQRQNMRGLDAKVKAELIRHNGNEIANGDTSNSSKSSIWGSAGSKSGKDRGRTEPAAGETDEKAASMSKRSRSRTRTFTFSKGDRSPSKRARSSSKSRSLMSLKNASSSSVHSMGMDGTKESKEQASTPATPEDFVAYLRTAINPQGVEIGRVHKLRILLRNETVSWVNAFISKDGMTELIGLLKRIMQVEWREEHEDLLLHEVLLCLKGLCTTDLAIERLGEVSLTLFPDLLKMIFDEERKGPSEFATRGIIFSLLFTYIAAAQPDQQFSRAINILSYLADPRPPDEERPVEFILQMHQSRPYQVWCKEVVNVTKEVFWIFSHHTNVISVPSDTSQPGENYTKLHFPKERAPVPAAPYIGGVEWDATNYLANHLDLMNGLIATLPLRSDRNDLRRDLRASGFEKLMGGSLRLCKEKFYGAVHDGLRTWVAAAVEDGWPVADVRMGPAKEESKSPNKSPKKQAPLPRLELPKFDL